MELILVEAFIFMIIPLIIACRGKERKTSFCVVICIFNHVIMWFLFCLIMLFNYGVAYNPGSISYVFFFLNYTLLKNGHRWFKNNPSAQLPPPIVPVPDVPSKLPDSSTHREESVSPKRRKVSKIRILKKKLFICRCALSFCIVLLLVLCVVFYHSYSALSSQNNILESECEQYKEEYLTLENTYKPYYRGLRNAYLNLFEEASSVKAQCDIVVLLLRDYSFPIDSLSEKLPALQRCLNTLYRSPKWE